MSYISYPKTTMAKLLNVFELSEALGRPLRQIRGLVQSRKIPFYKVGYRSLLFDPVKVEKALNAFEIPAVNAKSK
jgi:hypothetical protein